MASLWRHWSVKDLQELLSVQDTDLLLSLERVLPGILGDQFNGNDLYMRDSLIKIVEAFLPAEALATQKFRTACLNRLPLDELRACARAVGVRADLEGFPAQLDVVASHRWTAQFAAAFVAHFRLGSQFLPPRKELKPDHVDFEPPTRATPITLFSPFRQLKDYQFGVYLEACGRIDTPRARFMIQMPTGSGKTRTGMETVCFALARDEAPVVVWLAHSEELCEQAFLCFLDVWPHLADRPLRAHRYWGEHPAPTLEPTRASFIVAGFQKVQGGIKAEREFLQQVRGRCLLIVVDEAHKSEAPSYKQVIEALLGDDTRIVGLTATPGRTDAGEVTELAGFYFNQKIDLPTPPQEGVIDMLRRRGVLSHAKYVPIITGIDVELTPAQRRVLNDRLELPATIIEGLATSDVRNVEIVRRVVDECRRGSRILLFACSVKHSMFLTSILLYLGLRAGHVDGETDSSRRRDLIESFRHGDLQVLCNFGVLTTGFDAPNTDVVFITRPTQSPVLYSQMIGRGLRGPAIGGTATCTIIDVRDNILGYGDAQRVYALFDDYWAG